ncbi:MAG TPA: hypothetical protein VL943_11190, partial [Niabella sp.]|nr:hypothetical protein [Niabella sp.]
MKHLTLFLLAAISLLIACSKDNDQAKENACVRDNYAIVSISYGSTATRHSILVTYSNNSFREKITMQGIGKDTLHLSPGSYNIVAGSINDQDLLIEDKFFKNVALVQ